MCVCVLTSCIRNWLIEGGIWELQNGGKKMTKKSKYGISIEDLCELKGTI